MGFCFMCSRAARADDANITTPLDETNDEEASLGVVAENDLALFGLRMIGIAKDARERIDKYRDSFVERDMMLAEVGGRLALIPLELHAVSLACTVRSV